MQIARRAVLAGGVGAPLAACQKDPPLPPLDPGHVPLADAHAHLFNAADLPAGKFVEYVVLPQELPGAPAEAGAILDIVVNVLKLFVPTARGERIRRLTASSAEPDVTPEEFGRAVARRIDSLRAGEKALGPAGAQTLLLDSYRALVESLAVAGGAEPPSGLKALGEDRRVLAASAVIFADTARRALDPGAARKAALRGPRAFTAGRAANIVGWSFLMMQSRQHHLARYLKDYGPGLLTPRLIVNHLVDYDMWLGDGPIARSGHFDQIAFWSRVARARADRVDIRTFAGFCPLKHAIELREHGRGVSFERLKEAYGDKAIAGIKLYPPMGFRAAGNTPLKAADFVSPPGVGLGTTALDRWRRAGGSGDDLGRALDAALDDVFAWARDKDVPLMAHTGPGNQAGPGFGRRANPVWWEKAIERHPGLRLSLGHLVHDAGPFTTAVAVLGAGGQVDLSLPEHWALDAPTRIMTSRSRVYGDLGYMPELAGNEALAVSFFRALKLTYDRPGRDPGLKRILYGTDWIMLAIEDNGQAFPQTVREAMIEVLGKPAADDICWGNARRFLKLEA